jgi:tRNA threonylcarbamoyladenosine modification (KEOPS) complex  Pcc1 subunit
MAEAKFIIKMDSEEVAKITFESVKPEIKKKIANTETKIFNTGKNIYLNIKSKNTSSLRAACNSYLRWINTAYKIKKAI